MNNNFSLNDIDENIKELEDDVFDDTNDEFLQFKEEVKEWLALDDDIRT